MPTNTTTTTNTILITKATPEVEKLVNDEILQNSKELTIEELIAYDEEHNTGHLRNN